MGFGEVGRGRILKRGVIGEFRKGVLKILLR